MLETAFLRVVSSYGGKVILAGPDMEAMIAELADAAEAEAAASPPALAQGSSVWLVVRKVGGEVMGAYSNETDALVDVAMRHRSHRDRYKVEAWHVGGLGPG